MQHLVFMQTVCFNYHDGQMPFGSLFFYSSEEFQSVSATKQLIFGSFPKYFRTISFSDNRFFKFGAMLGILKPIRSSALKPIQRYHCMKKIIVDCDPGVDDAYALQFLFNAKNVEIKAITT